MAGHRWRLTEAVDSGRLSSVNTIEQSAYERKASLGGRAAEEQLHNGDEQPRGGIPQPDLSTVDADDEPDV